MINTCTKFEFNPSTSWGSYARHRHNLLHGARSTTDIKPWHKHTTGELKTVNKCKTVSPWNETCHMSQNMKRHKFAFYLKMSKYVYLVFIKPGNLIKNMQFLVTDTWLVTIVQSLNTDSK